MKQRGKNGEGRGDEKDDMRRDRRGEGEEKKEMEKNREKKEKEGGKGS